MQIEVCLEIIITVKKKHNNSSGTTSLFLVQSELSVGNLDAPWLMNNMHVFMQLNI